VLFFIKYTMGVKLELANNKLVTNNTSNCNILKEFNYSNANKERV